MQHRRPIQPRLAMVALAAGAVASCEAPRVAEVQKAVSAELRDPDSAKFTDVRQGQKNWVCGKVNGRNAYGVYAGAQRFVGLSKDYVAIEPEVGDPTRDLFEENWAKCTGEAKAEAASELNEVSALAPAPGARSR